MSCCSNCGGCGCSQCNYIVNLPDDPSDTYTAANIGVGGVGVYDSQSGFQFGFRNVNSANAMLTVTLDAPNAVVLLTVSAAAIAAAFPAATTTAAGILETATDAEAIAKAATDKILVPSNLAAIGASSTFAGLVELATNAETQAGVSTTLAVTPAGLASVTSAQKVTATWADDVARAALVPAFKGQFGMQLDTVQGYVATGTTAGDWGILITEGVIQTLDENTEVFLDANWTFSGSGTLLVSSDTLQITSNSIVITGGGTLACDIAWSQDASLNLSNGNLDFTNYTVQISGANIANSVLISGGTNLVSSKLISTFISTSNTQTGWAVTNPSVTRTLDVSAATLAETRAVLGTLINDLKAVLLPAT